MAGSTVEVAEAVAGEIAHSGIEVDVLPLEQVQQLQGYDGVVVGAPMIMGWHRAALKFLRKQRQAWQRIPLAVFVMAMSLTETGERQVDGVPVTVDENLPKAPQKEGHLSFREQYARLSGYLRPILKASAPVTPASIGVFGGRMEYGRLPWWGVLFAMFVVRAAAGDRRDWTAIRAWAAELPAAMKLQTAELA
jgi:menaquinone-dependent protoporphyrinogen oxidase